MAAWRHLTENAERFGVDPSPSLHRRRQRRREPRDRPPRCGSAMPANRCRAASCSPTRSMHFPTPPTDPALLAELDTVPAMLRFPEQYQLGIVHNYLGRVDDLPADVVPGNFPVDGLPEAWIAPSEYDDLRAIRRALRLAAEGGRHPGAPGGRPRHGARAPGPRPVARARRGDPRLLRVGTALADTERRLMGLPAFLFGFRVKQPREYLRLRRIRSRIYTRVATLDAEIVRSPEPTTVRTTSTRPDSARSGPARRWGKVFDCAWLRIRGEVPDGIQNPCRDARHRRRRGSDLRPRWRRCSTRSAPSFQQGDLPHAGGGFHAGARRHARTTARSTSSPMSPTTGSSCIRSAGPDITGAHVATRDDEAYALYYDYLTLAVLMGSTQDAALAADLRVALGRGVGSLPRTATSRGRGPRSPRRSPRRVRERLHLQRHRPRAPRHGMALAAARDATQGRPHLHARAQHDRRPRPGYIYGTSQPQQLYWMKQQHPVTLRAHQDGRRRSGRIELQGSFWVETDTNLPGGESLVRQAMVGRRFLAGGVRARPTTTCGCAGCPTPSATTATCRRSCGRAAWTGS